MRIPKLLTRPQTARVLGLTEGRLSQMATAGEGPPYKIIDGRFYYHPATLRIWADQRRETRDLSAIRHHLDKVERALDDLRAELGRQT